MFGVNHAYRYNAVHVSMGLYAQTKPGTFPILYQYESYSFGDYDHFHDEVVYGCSCNAGGSRRPLGGALLLLLGLLGLRGARRDDA